jgi:catechol-2,3-dioxygenase
MYFGYASLAGAERSIREAIHMARIRHLAILTEDVERLVKFYTNSFGLKIVKGVGTATYLTTGI